MKKTNYIFLIILLLVIIAFSKNNRREIREESTEVVVFSSAEFIGKWDNALVGKTKKDNGSLIQSIEFVNDSIVSIQFIDSTGIKTVNGEWETEFQKEMNRWVKLEFKADVKISYMSDKSHLNYLLLKLKKKNEKVVLTADHIELVKK